MVFLTHLKGLTMLFWYVEVCVSFNVLSLIPLFVNFNRLVFKWNTLQVDDIIESFKLDGITKGMWYVNG